jgi:hypothetical protein
LDGPIALAQPAQRQLEHRARPAETAVFALEVGDFLCRRHLAKFWQFGRRQAMDACNHPAQLPRQYRPRLGELFIAKNLARNGLALDTPHDEAGAEFVLRLEHMHHPRRRQAGVMRELHQNSLGIEACGPPR